MVARRGSHINIEKYPSPIAHTTDYADEHNHPALRRCRFIAHTADLSALGAFPEATLTIPHLIHSLPKLPNAVVYPSRDF